MPKFETVPLAELRTRLPAKLMPLVEEYKDKLTMRALIPHMGPTCFARWTVRGAQLPVRWDEAFRR